MGNKKILFISIFILMIVLSIGAVSAQDADDAIASTDDETVLEDSEPTASGTVSGGVDVVTENPWTNNGELSYDIPADAKTIKSADVYVNVYSVNRDDRNGVETNVTVITDNGQISYNESLSYKAEDRTQVYTINDNVTKSNLDYMIHYDITNQLAGLNGTNLKIKVNTSAMVGKEVANNLGYIKLIGLIVTYDDGDDDIIKYWINDNQIWTNSNTTLTFDTASLNQVLEMTLTNIALDSSDATYKLNGEFLTDPEYKSGSYYRYNKWDVTDYFNSSKKTEFLGIGAQGSYGVSHKQALAVLTAKPGEVSASVSIATERQGKVYSDTNVPIAYPGLSNKITITVNTNKNGKYVVKLLADGNEVNSTEVFIKAGTEKIYLIDNTIRPINSSSVYTNRSGNYDKVNYTAQLFLKNESLNNASIDAVILYNGYFNKALYDQNSLEAFYTGTITGDIFINVSDFVKTDGTSGKYAGGTTNRVDNWTVELNNDSVIVKAFIYIPYTSITGDNSAMLSTVFNNNTLTPIHFIRDQTNAVGAGGYGVLVYDVTEYIINGNNTLSLNRTLSGGIYPSTLIYLTNTTGSNVVKEVSIYNCADVLGAYGNGDRKLKIDSTFNITSSEATNATVYIFGAGSNDAGRASISINGVIDDDVWNPVVKDTVKYYEKDITAIMKDSNEISLILNKGMFTALQQIMVVTKNATAPTPEKVATKITASTVTITYNTNSKNLVATLTDANGNAIANAQVTINFNGKTTPVTTNDKGEATLAIASNLVPNTYTATITYDGDDTHIKSDAKATVKINKASVKLTAKKKTFKAKVKTKKYTVTLKNNKGKAMKKVKLTLKVKGKTFKATTNSKGKATFKITNLKKKANIKAKLTYKGDKYFNKVTKTVNIKVKK